MTATAGTVGSGRAARLWQRLVTFGGVHEDATALALCRIAVGITVLGHIGRFWASGTAALALVHTDLGGIGTSHGWLERLGGATPAHVDVLCLVVLAAAALVTLGMFTRPALAVLWLSYRALSMLNGDARGGYDPLLINTMFLLLLSGCGNALSLDARLFAPVRARGGQATRWPRVLLVFQLGLMYSASALMKASSGWVPGGDASALWFILHQPMWARFPSDWLPLWTAPFMQLSTTLVWCWELLGLLFVAAVLLHEDDAPATRAGVWLKRTLERVRFRELYLVFGVAMHVGIEVLMEVGAFTLASFALYVCAVEPRVWRRALERLKIV